MLVGTVGYFRIRNDKPCFSSLLPRSLWEVLLLLFYGIYTRNGLSLGDRLFDNNLATDGFVEVVVKVVGAGFG